MSTDTPFRKALLRLERHLDAAHAVLHDPYKPPEAIIAMLPQVQAAMWDAQVEYAALSRAAVAS